MTTVFISFCILRGDYWLFACKINQPHYWATEFGIVYFDSAICSISSSIFYSCRPKCACVCLYAYVCKSTFSCHINPQCIETKCCCVSTYLFIILLMVIMHAGVCNIYSGRFFFFASLSSSNMVFVLVYSRNNVFVLL